MATSLKRTLYQILETAHPNDRLSWLVDWAMVLLIIANVAAAMLGTLTQVRARYGVWLDVFELVSVIIFTLEYITRLWVSTEHLPLAGWSPIRARLRYAVSPYAMIDLIAILPFYVSLFMPAADLRILRLFRLLRLLKLMRYSPALATLGRVLIDERRALGAALLIMFALLMIAATAMYYAERTVQPEAFGSIPAAMWWGLATLTTVGYGDLVPITGLGKVIGGMVMIFGLGMFALPIGIVASGFATEIHRRDFVVTWGMIARVPLFATLDVLSVSRITNLLRSRLVQPNTVILRRGDPAGAIYFIAAGEVEVDAAEGPMRLREGDFFGEISVLRDAPRSATVRSVTRCRLLELGAEDFRELIEIDGDLRDAVTKVAESRLNESHPT